MNSVALVGNMTRDPEVRQAGETSVARFTVAVSRRFKNKDGNYDSDFIQCQAFGATAQFIEKYFHKGDKIGVTGEIRTGSYTNNSGDKVYTTDVNVNTVEFVQSKSSGKAPVENKDGFIQIPDGVDDEALPFN